MTQRGIPHPPGKSLASPAGSCGTPAADLTPPLVLPSKPHGHAAVFWVLSASAGAAWLMQMALADCSLLILPRTHRITITNFCLGKHLVSEDDLLKDQRGSPAYISPDVLSGRQPLSGSSQPHTACISFCPLTINGSQLSPVPL